MPVLTSLSLLSTTVSGLIQTAGHVVDALDSAKTRLGKKSDSPNQTQSASQLANLFTAYLAAAAQSAPGQAAPSTSSNVPQTGSLKSAKDATAALMPLSVVFALGPTTAISASLALHPEVASAKAASKAGQPPSLTPGTTSTLPATANVLNPAMKQTAGPVAMTPVPAKGTVHVPAASVSDRSATTPAQGAKNGQSMGRQTSESSAPGLTIPAGQGALSASHQQTTANMPVLALHDVPVSTPQDNSHVATVSKASESGTRPVSPVVPSHPKLDVVGSASVAVLAVPKFSTTAAVGQTKLVTWTESTKPTSNESVNPKNTDDSTSTTGNNSVSQIAGPQLALTSVVTVGGSYGQISGNAAAAGSNNSQTTTPIAVQLSNAVIAQASVVNHEGRTDFHLRLQPPQLGSVQIHLTATHDKVSARVIVAQEETRQLIVSQAHELRQSLAQSGLVLGNFDVTRDGGGSSQGGYHQQPELPQSQIASSATPTGSAVSKAPQNSATDGIDILA